MNKDFKEKNIKEKGYIPIEDNLNDNRLRFEDKNGYKYDLTVQSYNFGDNYKKASSFNKYSFENIKTYIILNNLKTKFISEIKENEKFDNNKKYKFLCENCNDNYFECYWHKFLDRKSYLCKECYKNSLKLDKEIAINLFNKNGLNLYDNFKYNGNQELIDCYDNENYKYQINYNNLLSGKMPEKFSKYNKYTIENIKNYISINNFNSELLSIEYKSNTANLDFICKDCNKNFKRSWASFYSGLGVCNNCTISKANDSKRLDYKQVKETFLEKGYILLEKEYKNNAKRLLCSDKNGYKGFLSHGNLISGNKDFHKFSYKYNKQNLIHNLNKYCENKKINLKILEIIDKYHILALCECGNEFKLRKEQLFSKINPKIKCNDCTKYTSTLEIKTKDFLEENKISFIEQKSFLNCKSYETNFPLRFDFYLPDYNCCIECDGEQHFRAVEYFGGEKGFIKQKHNDNIKNKYCEGNNIKLIRIPYFEFNNENYIKIITKLING